MDAVATVDAAAVAVNVYGQHGDDNNDGALHNAYGDVLKMVAKAGVADAVALAAEVE